MQKVTMSIRIAAIAISLSTLEKSLEIAQYTLLVARVQNHRVEAALLTFFDEGSPLSLDGAVNHCFAFSHLHHSFLHLLQWLLEDTVVSIQGHQCDCLPRTSHTRVLPLTTSSSVYLYKIAIVAQEIFAESSDEGEVRGCVQFVEQRFDGKLMEPARLTRRQLMREPGIGLVIGCDYRRYHIHKHD